MKSKVEKMREWAQDPDRRELMHMMLSVGAGLIFFTVVYAIYVKIGRPKVSAVVIDEAGALVVELARGKGSIVISQDKLIKVAFTSLITTKELVPA